MGRRKSPPPPSYGEGGKLQTLANGKVRGRVMVNGRRESVTGTDPEEVRAMMRALRDTDGEVTVSDSPTLGEWSAEWLADFAPDVSDNTTTNYGWALAKFDPLADVLMDELTSAMVTERLRELSKGPKPLSRRTLAIVRQHLAHAVDGYNDVYERDRNPARRAKLPKSAPRGATERRTLTVKQADAFIRAARNHDHGIALVLMVNLGLRPGEATGLPWSAVDLEAGTLNVVQFRRVTPKGGRKPREITMAAPKSKSDRRIQLPRTVVMALRRHKKAQTAQRLKSRYWHDNGLVVTSATGRPLDPSNLRKIVVDVAKDAGIEWDPALRPYELRHTAASLLIEQGVPLEEVADLLGHSVKVLIDHYRHRSKRVVSAHVDHLETMFGGTQ